MEGKFFDVSLEVTNEYGKTKVQKRVALNPIHGKEYIVGRTFHALCGEDIKAIYIGYDGKNHVFIRKTREEKLERYVAKTCLVNYLSDGEDDPVYPHSLQTEKDNSTMKTSETEYAFSILKRFQKS